MTLQRMDNVLIVVDDLEGAKAFAEPRNAPANTLGIRRIMFTVDDLDEVLARLRTRGAELVGEVAQYEDKYREASLNSESQRSADGSNKHEGAGH